jgi:hypothetical protein
MHHRFEVTIKRRDFNIREERLCQTGSRKSDQQSGGRK